MLYLIALIAKVDRKETFYLKHEIVFCQKEKRSKMFQVKAVSKDVRKTIVPSKFHLNLSRSVVLCVKKMEI